MTSIRVASAIFGILLTSMGCRNSEQSMSGYPGFKPTIDINSSDTAVSMPVLFANLDRQFAKKGIKAAPPLSEQEIGRLEQQLPCVLPPMLKEMYRWHNGATSFIPFYDWLSLAGMLEEYRFIKKIDKEVGLSAEDGWPTHFLPILRFDGKTRIALDCKSLNHTPLFLYYAEDATPIPAYRGVGHLLTVTLTAYESGAYDSYFDGRQDNPIEVAKAFRKHALPNELQAMEDNWALLEKMLRNLNGEDFRAVNRYIYKAPDERAIPLLREYLHDPDPAKVTGAISALGTLQAQAARPELNALLKHENVNVRNFATHAIANLPADKTDSAIDSMLALLNDSNDQVRISAIEALEQTKSPRAVGPLLEMLPRSRPGIQVYLAHALGTLKDTKALPALKELQTKLSAMDLNTPMRGGTRGSDPTPVELKARVDAAIKQIEG